MSLLLEEFFRHIQTALCEFLGWSSPKVLSWSENILPNNNRRILLNNKRRLKRMAEGLPLPLTFHSMHALRIRIKTFSALEILQNVQDSLLLHMHNIMEEFDLEHHVLTRNDLILLRDCLSIFLTKISMHRKRSKSKLNSFWYSFSNGVLRLSLCLPLLLKLSGFIFKRDISGYAVRARDIAMILNFLWKGLIALPFHNVAGEDLPRSYLYVPRSHEDLRHHLAIYWNMSLAFYLSKGRWTDLMSNTNFLLDYVIWEKGASLLGPGHLKNIENNINIHLSYLEEEKEEADVQAAYGMLLYSLDNFYKHVQAHAKKKERKNLKQDIVKLGKIDIPAAAKLALTTRFRSTSFNSWLILDKSTVDGALNVLRLYNLLEFWGWMGSKGLDLSIIESLLTPKDGQDQAVSEYTEWEEWGWRESMQVPKDGQDQAVTEQPKAFQPQFHKMLEVLLCTL